ncbi:CD3337/EF1877 family mobilome membrane protein [Enterococcus faecium]
MNEKTKKILWAILLIGGITFLFLLLFGTVAQAVGLVDDTVSADNLYSAYPLANYKLDFYVDTDWDWLPWNWKDGIGNQVQYGLYAVSDFLWTISLYLSTATGYLIQQAYKLDFISDTANQIGENIQVLAGVSENGFSTSGFYVGFLLLFILIVGAYVAYVGLITRETSKAIQAVTNFVVVFLLSSGFIAFAPSYIQQINEFSADISQASLDLGSQIILPHSDSQGKDSVDSIRDTLFSVQVEQPWLLLQFDNSNKEELGESRVKALLEASPDTNNGKNREAVVKKEIEENDNQNLTLTKTVNRLGMVSFLILFNIGISIFVFLLTGVMIFSQILFILYAMFVPISFLLSMLPTFTGMAKSALMKLFNTILLRAGITLIITVAFSLSTMLYALTNSYPFFLVAFLQIVTFAGIYLKMGDIMSFFHLQAGDSQQVSRSVMRRPKQTLHRGARRLQRTVTRTMMGGSMGYLAGKVSGKKRLPAVSTGSPHSATHSDSTQPKQSNLATRPTTRSYQTGQTIGKVLDSRHRVATYAATKKQQVQELPNTINRSVQQSVTEFKQGISDERTVKGQTKRNRPATVSTTQQQTTKSRSPKPTHQRAQTRPISTVNSKQRKNPIRNEDKQSIRSSNRPVTKTIRTTQRQSRTMVSDQTRRNQSVKSPIMKERILPKGQTVKPSELRQASSQRNLSQSLPPKKRLTRPPRRK